MKHLSIRWRMTLWYSIALGVILCSFCLVLLLLMRQQILVRTDAGLREEVKEIGLEIGLAPSAAAFETQAEARFSQHDFYEFLVVDRNGGIVFASSQPPEAGTDTPSIATTPGAIEIGTIEFGDSGPYRVAVAGIESAFGKLQVRVMRSLKPIYADLNTLKFAMAGLLPLGVALALASGYFLAGRALRPVQDVVEVANSITITSLDRRIAVGNPHDEIGQLAAALNSLIDRLERAVTEIRRFTADASHEIRTPIASLRSEAESALRAPRTAAEYVQTLEVVVEETTRLGRLTDQLLNLSRHDAGITQSALESVQLNALLGDVAEQLQPFAHDRGVTLTCQSVATCEVIGDDIRLSQVFFNCLENAIKYTPPGGEVAIRLQTTAQSAIVEIQDNGIGIPESDVPHIFERFYRVDPSRQTDSGGAGLGLSIAKAAVLAHDGTIDLRSQLESGTTVTIRIPLSADSPNVGSVQTNLLNV